jgi:uncharacterized repeat protein (TIGR03803 family)
MPLGAKLGMALLRLKKETRNRQWITLIYFCSFIANLVQAQTYTAIKTFSALSSINYTNSDGANPHAGVILFGGSLYGVTESGGDGGGIYGSGTIFKMNCDGSGYTVLKSFTGAVNSLGTNNDGTLPVVELAADGETLYGAASNGGTNDLGTIFKINTDGTGFQVLKQATITEAAGLFGKMVLSGGVIYGAAFSGGAFTNGSVFKLNTNGTDFVTLKSFGVTPTNESGAFTNSDGASPQASLTLADDGTLFGTTVFGGLSGRGTIFRIKSDGSEFAVLKHFSALSVLSPRTNSDGANPISCLILDGNFLYGTTWLGGTGGFGTVFKMNTNGSGYTVLKHFNKSDGASPFAGLVISGHTIYGTTMSGGNATNGTIFKLNTDGSGFSVLKHFSTTPGSSLGFTNSDGAKPYAGLFLDGSTLYGTTALGGSSARGVIFKVELSPPLNFQMEANKLVLTWTDSNFSLQTSADLIGTFTNIPGATSPFTNSLDESRKFFRLISD